MASVNISTDGVVHGRTIELSQDLGLGDGQHVRVTVETVDAPNAWGEGIRRSAGAMADWPELDDIFASIQRDRQIERRADST